MVRHLKPVAQNKQISQYIFIAILCAKKSSVTWAGSRNIFLNKLCIDIKFTNVIFNFVLGGLIYHYFHDPIQLEITIDYSVYEFVDDSDTKLTMETFLVLFILLYVGMAIGIITLIIEIWIYKKTEKKRISNQRWFLKH